MFNIEFNKEESMNSYLYPPADDLNDEEEDLLYDDYVYEIYRAMLGYMKDIEKL